MIKTRLAVRIAAPAGMPSVLPHHRRRRALALAAVAVIAWSAGAAVGAAGGSAARHHTLAPSSNAARSQRLARSGALSAAEETAENAAIDRTLAYTPYVRVAGSQHREVALTFDDGPGPYTPGVLSALAQQNVPATFFEVGVMEDYFHASTTAIVTRGYPIGDHTETHIPMGKLSVKDQRTQLLEQVSATGAYGAPFPRLFRPPDGSWDDATLRLLHRYRMLMVLWTVDTNDYRRPGVPAIVHAAVAGARPGAIILLHDAGGDRSETVAALPKIIRALHARGYMFVTVPKLLLDNPPQRNQKVAPVVGGGG